jgi:poly(beta-D-mannuronate) lyase
MEIEAGALPVSGDALRRIPPMFAGVAALLVVAAVSTTACSRPNEESPVSPTPSPTTSAPADPSTAPPTPEQHDAPSDRRYPSEVLDLSNWYLTLPTGQERDPDDVYQPDLTTYVGSYFRLNDTRDGVVFTANAGGVTTPGSSYPRSELREMSGANKASWSNVQGTHTLEVRQAVTRLPQVKPHVVTAQIHDAEDDVMLVRLEGERLMVEYHNGDGEVVIDPAYRLGTPYDLRIVAADSHVEVYYNGELKADIPVSGSGWYFKSGSYVQSNLDRGDQADAVSEVVIYSLQVTHSR